MAELRKFQDVIAKLRSRAAAARTDTDVAVTVGYTQSYAIYVHENLEAHHPVGQAKFLEQPARELTPELGKIVASAMRQGQTMAQALVLAGLRLQRESQQLVPVDTGALKGSAFTRLEAADGSEQDMTGAD